MTTDVAWVVLLLYIGGCMSLAPGAMLMALHENNLLGAVTVVLAWPVQACVALRNYARRRV